MYKSLFSKIAMLFVFLIIGLIIGQLLLMLMMWMGGADFSLAASGQEAILASMESNLPFKIGIGLNNLIMFGCSAIAFIIWIIKERVIPYTGMNRNIDIWTLALSVLAMVCSYPLLGYSMQVMTSLDLPDWAGQMDSDSVGLLASMLEMNNMIDLIIGFIIIGIIPSVAEELFFRGAMQRSLNEHLSNHHIAIWIASFVFAAVHMQIVGLPPKLILGLVLGYVYYYTRNLWYPILMHLFNNGSQVIALYFSGESLSEMDMDSGPEIPWYGAIISLILVVIIIRYIAHQNNNADVIRA